MSSSQPLARIDLNALARNYAEVERLTGDSTEILAMVKANAYGHGARAVTARLVQEGCKRFGVATLDEAEVVREAAPHAAVAVFGGVVAADAERAVGLGVEIVTQEPSVIEALGVAAAAVGANVAVHIKVDTGMRRFGIEPKDAAELVALTARTERLRPVALCSHFAMAESVTTEVTEGQLERLAEAATAVKNATGLELPCHLANSAAIMTRAAAHLQMVRPGLMLYGLYPDAALRGHAELAPVMTLDAPVVRVAEVGRGEGIGYGHSYHAKRACRVATLRCGYADGYPRALSNRGTVLMRGKRAAVVGRVCMDHIMVDVSEIEQEGPIGLGERAVLWGPGLDAGEVAAQASTISYELVARVGARVERVYGGI